MPEKNELISEAAIFRSLVRLETKQDQILSNQHEITADHKELKERMNKVENRQNWFMGAIAATGAGFTILTKMGLI